MEIKKYLPLKIVHLLVMVAGVVLFGIVLFGYFDQGSVLGRISTVVNIIALCSGIVYLVFGYKKDATLFYKIFMWLYVIATIVDYTSMYRTTGVGNSSVFVVTLAKFVSFALIVLLAGAKDYGVVKSNVISLSLLAINIFIFIDICISAEKFSNAGMLIPILFTAIGQFILACTAAFMVCGKYLDKSARGTK